MAQFYYYSKAHASYATITLKNKVQIMSNEQKEALPKHEPLESALDNTTIEAASRVNQASQHNDQVSDHIDEIIETKAKLTYFGNDSNRVQLQEIIKKYPEPFAKELLELGVDPKALLDRIGVIKHTDTIETFLTYGLNPNLILHYLASEENFSQDERYIDALLLLLKAGADAQEIVPKINVHVLHSVIDTLIEAGVDGQLLADHTDSRYLLEDYDTLVSAGAKLPVEEIIDRTNDIQKMAHINKLNGELGANINVRELIQRVENSDNPYDEDYIFVFLNRLKQAAPDIDFQPIIERRSTSLRVNNLPYLKENGIDIDANKLLDAVIAENEPLSDTAAEELVKAGADTKKLSDYLNKIGARERT